MIQQQPSKITFEQGLGCGRYKVLADGVEIGEVFSCMRFGQRMWKPCGLKQYFPTRQQAAMALVGSQQS